MHAVTTPPDAPCTSTVCPGRSAELTNSIRYAVSHAVGRQAASAKDSSAGFGTTLRLGTISRSARAPWCFSDSSVRLGSSVSSPSHPSLAITEWTTTSSPVDVSMPAASQPRIIGNRSALMPTPRSVHRSWWLRLTALTSTVVQPGGGSGSGRSPITRPASGSSGNADEAYAARMGATLGQLGRRVHRVVEVDGGVGEPEPASRPLAAARDRDRLGEVRAHWGLLGEVAGVEVGDPLPAVEGRLDPVRRAIHREERVAGALVAVRLEVLAVLAQDLAEP